MKPAVFGIAGRELTADEQSFLRDEQPLGVILFRRNIETPDQVRGLNDSIRRAIDRDGPLVWVDQEGGRVQRLAEPHWEKLPAAAKIAAVWERDPDMAEYAAWLSGRIIADQVRSAGFDIACAPVLDLTIPGAHEVIGDRAFGADPEQVATLGRAQADGLKAGGVVPVSKHWPGHGRTTVDSHDSLPRVEIERDDLLSTDFEPFRLAADCAPIAMTAHQLFQAIDAERPATLSPVIIQDVMRGHCGFDGFIVSDDLDMKALAGGRGELARQALEAGCDGLLQCSGDFATMREVADAIGPITPAALERWNRIADTISGSEDVDRHQLLHELDDVIA